MNAQNRRKENRVEFDALAFIEKEQFGGADQARIINISPNGMSIQTSLPVLPQEYLSVQLQNPITEEHIRLMADVLWVEPVGQDLSQIGLRFHPLNHELKAKVTQLMTTLDFGYEPSNAHGRFSLEDNIQAEIEKIIHTPDDLTTDQTDLSGTQASINLDQEAIATLEPEPTPTTTLNPIEFKASPALPKRKSGPSVSLIVFLMGLIGAGLYFFKNPTVLQNWTSQFKPKAKQTSQPASPSGAVEVANDNMVTDQAPTSPSESMSTSPTVSYPYNGGMTMPSQKWLETVLWNGDAQILMVDWSFAQNIAFEDIQVEKITFDNTNKRYLVKIPAQPEILSQKEILFDHPLVQKARLGMHQQDGRISLHIVFGVEGFDTTLEIKRLEGNLIQTVFTK